jgi:D-galactarolactone isomerase
MSGLLPAAPPRTPVPPGACDCHMHAYGDPSVYPVNPDSPFRPVAGGTVEEYLKVRTLLGLERAVVVQPSAYGTDNRCTLDAMATIGNGARGVAVIDDTAGDAEIDRLTRLGVRGLRFFMLPGGVLPWEALPRLAARVAPFGWHIQMQMDGRFLHEREADLSRLPCPLVIDHNGKFLEPVDLDHPGFAALCRLIDTGRTWVKTSGVYETSKVGPPEYADVAVLPRALIARYPQRCVWATNWPHPSKPGNPPDDAHLLDLFAGWCGSGATFRQVLVENPAALYGFPAA